MIRTLYYSAEARAPGMLAAVRDRLLAQQPGAIRIGAVQVARPLARLAGLDPHDNQRYRIAAENIYVRILAGLQAVADTDFVYLAEDDVLYSDEHFTIHERLPSVTWNYDLNLIYLTPAGFAVVHNRASISLSMSVARADIMRGAVIRKLEEIRTGAWSCFEPAGSQGYATGHTWAETASLDIRENAQHTWSVGPEIPLFQQEPGWPSAAELVETYKLKETRP
jgi:hypothetical protein